MGRSIRTNNVDEWEVFSSITDSVIAKFETEHDLKVWLANEDIYKGKLKAIEVLMSFPSHWNVNGERQFKKSGYYDWLSSIEDVDTYDEYHGKIDKKLEQLMKGD